MQSFVNLKIWLYLVFVILNSKFSVLLYFVFYLRDVFRILFYVNVRFYTLVNFL